jgi:lipid-A-disaccharide synthase-like uncharacterized protein
MNHLFLLANYPIQLLVHHVCTEYQLDSPLCHHYFWYISIYVGLIFHIFPICGQTYSFCTNMPLYTNIPHIILVRSRRED